MRLAYLVHYSAVRTRDDYCNYFSQITNEHNRLIDYIQNGKAREAKILAGQHTRLFQENVARYLMEGDLRTISMPESR